MNCILDRAILTACRLVKTVLLNCQMNETELSDTDLRGADLRGSELRGLTGVMSLRGTVVNEGQMSAITTAFARDLALDVRGE
jgi:uncharacterized protein YjbI with pentapeptide repeats